MELYSFLITGWTEAKSEKIEKGLRLLPNLKSLFVGDDKAHGYVRLQSKLDQKSLHALMRRALMGTGAKFRRMEDWHDEEQRTPTKSHQMLVTFPGKADGGLHHEFIHMLENRFGGDFELTKPYRHTDNEDDATLPNVWFLSIMSSLKKTVLMDLIAEQVAGHSFHFFWIDEQPVSGNNPRAPAKAKNPAGTKKKNTPR